MGGGAAGRGPGERLGPPLYAAVGALAQRAGWAAFDDDSHDVARTLLTIALHAAVRADDPDLRAHVLADFAVQHLHLGYPNDCLYVVRFAAVDERVGPAVQVLDTVKARAYGLRGDADRCREHLRLARQSHQAAGTATGWQATVATGARLAAATGHALATLAGRTGKPADRDDAGAALCQAAELLDPAGDARAVGLCGARLAWLHLDAGDPRAGLTWATRALEIAARVRSVRLDLALAEVRTAAAGHGDEPAVQDLLADLDHHRTTPTPAPDEDTRPR